MTAPTPSKNPAFKPVRLQHVMREVRRPVRVSPAATYKEIGVRSHGRGVFHKEPLTGEMLGNKRVFWLQPGTLVFNIVFAWERAVAVLTDAERGLIGSHRFPTYEMLPGRADPGFMKHYFTTGYGHFLLQLNSPGAAGRNKTLSQSALRKEEVWLPPAGVQRAIANFLDRKTAAIDALIEKKERLIALLAEKRAALINRAVTKGLNPDAPMKDSGVPWIGEVPDHWDVLPMRRLLNGISQGWSPVCEDREPEHGEWTVLKLSAVSQGQFRDDQRKVLPAHESPRLDLTVREGDLLVTRSNTPELVGDACVVRKPTPRQMLSDLIYRLEPNRRATGDFLCFYLLSAAARTQIKADARGTSQSMVKVSQGHIRDWRVSAPPIAEQSHIATVLDAHECGFLHVVRELKTQIEKLHEYRQALITAAVTGQIDVTKEAAA